MPSSKEMLKSIDAGIGNSVQHWREVRGKSVEDCARMLMISPAAFIAAEEGRRSFAAADLFVLATIFDCKISDFFVNIGQF